MRVALVGLVATCGGVLAVLLLPHPLGVWTAAAALLGFVALLARGMASVRSSLLEPTVWRSGDPADTRVALTFDDGPHPAWTPELLDTLAEHDVRATFFVVGANVRRFPGVVSRIAEAGHDIGCHADSHAPLTAFYSRRRMAAEVEACRAAVRDETGRTPRLYRPPYGIRSPAHCGMARELDLVTVGMARRGLDKATASDAGALAERVVSAVRAGDILALHDGDEPGRTRASCAAVEALPAILSGLERRGLRPVPVSTLIAERAYVESPARPWSGRTHGGHTGNAVFFWLVRTVGTGPAHLLLVFVAAWFTLFKGASRRASLALLQHVHGRRALPARLLWVYRHFLVYGRTLLWRLEFLIRGGRPPDLTHVGFDRIRETMETPGPLLLVSAHHGDWSGASRLLQVRERRPLSVVAYRGVGMGPHQVRETSSGAAYTLIDVEASPQDVAIAIMSALSRGEAVAVHADRTTQADSGVAVPFLGAEAVFPTGVWKLAMLSGAPALVYFAIPLSSSAGKLYCYGPIRVPRVPKEQRAEALRAAAAKFAEHLEDCVRRHPLHWGNFYDFWSRS